MTTPTLLVLRDETQAPRGEAQRIARQLARSFGEIESDIDAWVLRQGQAPPRQAIGVLAEVEKLLLQARIEAANLAEGEALKTLAEADRRIRQHLALDGAAAWHAEVQVRIGLVAAQAGLPALATQALRRAVLIDPTRQIGAAEAAPATVELAAQLRREVALAPRGHFLVDSQPNGAAVFLDDVSLGRTPLTISAPVGPHLLRLSAKGHSSSASFVDVLEGRRAPLRVSLAVAPEATRARELVELSRRGEYEQLPSRLAALAEDGIVGRLLVAEQGSPADRALVTICVPEGCRGPSRMVVGAHRITPADAALSAEALSSGRRWLVARAKKPLARGQTPLWERWYVWSAAFGVVAAATLTAVLAQPEPSQRSLRVVVDPGDVGQ